MQRDKVYDKIRCVCINSSKYEREVFWSDLQMAEGIKSTDIIESFKWERKETPPGWMSHIDDPPTVSYDFVINVLRERQENDQEYFARMQKKAADEAKKKEDRRLKYLELKAEFENEDK